jgi:PAS domain S-box-containing protein
MLSQYHLQGQPATSPPAADSAEQAYLTLDESGLICYCSKGIEDHFGYKLEDLVWRHLSRIFPKLLVLPLTQGGELNPKLKYLCHCGHQFEILDKQGNTVLTEVHLVKLANSGNSSIRLILGPTTVLGH